MLLVLVLCSVGEPGHCKAQRTISLNLVAPTPNDPPLISRLSTPLPGCWPLIRFFSCMACLRLRQEIGERPSLMHVLCAQARQGGEEPALLLLPCPYRTSIRCLRGLTVSLTGVFLLQGGCSVCCCCSALSLTLGNDHRRGP